MKKTAIALFGLSLALLFLPSTLPAPFPQISIDKICVTGEAYLYRVTVTNLNTYPVNVTVMDDGQALGTNVVLDPSTPLVYQYGDPTGCSSVANTATAWVVGYESYAVTDTATCVCEEDGCTLTWGYWKTHSINGPAPYNDTWALVGETTPFFTSGYTWYSILFAEPAGNPYFSLAHQYIAAYLNGLAGASVDAIAAEMGAAAALLAKGPGWFTKGGGHGADRAAAVNLASILDSYNIGVIGPGHCNSIVR